MFGGEAMPRPQDFAKIGARVAPTGLARADPGGPRKRAKETNQARPLSVHGVGFGRTGRHRPFGLVPVDIFPIEIFPIDLAARRRSILERRGMSWAPKLAALAALALAALAPGAESFVPGAVSCVWREG